MNNRKSYVYKIMCLVTGEFYFGSSFNAKRDSYWGSGRKIKEMISQYGKENFVKEILGEFYDRTEAHRVENEYIEQFRNDDKCLNERLEHQFGAFSDESRTKNSNALRGKTFSKEHKERISAALKGLMSGEKSAWYGKHLSEEHRAKMSAARRGKPHPHGKHWRKNPVTGKREYYD